MQSGISAETALAHRFVLEGMDPRTNCIAHDLGFEVEDPGRLCARRLHRDDLAARSRCPEGLAPNFR
jgi:hypothetical protein